MWLIELIKKIFKKEELSEFDKLLKGIKKNKLSLYETPYVEENGCVYLKNPHQGILIDDFRSSGESKEHYDNRIKLKKLRQERLKKLKKINKK